MARSLEWGFAFRRLNLYVNAQNAEFSITTRIDILPDEDLTSLAAKVGMAVADLVMERLGFHWRANMQEIELNSSPPEVGLKKRRPDFVYDPAVVPAIIFVT